MIAPSAIRTDARASGYKYVAFAGVGNTEYTKPYQAKVRVRQGLGSGTFWHGPRRATALEAAQDYCDWSNSGQHTPAAPTLNSAGHTGRRESLPQDPEVVAALGVLRDARGQRRGRQGYVYLIAETLRDTQLVHIGKTAPLLVKVGYSTNPQARLSELQTANGRVLKLLAYFKGTVADEQRLHAKFRHLNTVQEWFRPTVALLSEFGLYADGSERSPSAGRAKVAA